MATESAAASSDRSLFDNKFLSDVTIKFGGQQLSCHKVVLARKSEYFYRAFSSQFSVATSNEVNLGDGEDEEPEVIRAMIRHMYDLPYDQMLVDDTADDSAAYSTNEDLLFHISVFTVADKYDVACLRPLVVKKFKDLMETNWEGENFAASVQKLTGPSAGHLADNTLQAAAAAFCANNLRQLIKKDSFVKMIEEEEPFTGRLLTGFLNGEPDLREATTVQLKTCKKPGCIEMDPSEITRLNNNCIVCNETRTTDVRTACGWGSGLVDYREARILQTSFRHTR